MYWTDASSAKHRAAFVAAFFQRIGSLVQDAHSTELLPAPEETVMSIAASLSLNALLAKNPSGSEWNASGRP